MLLRKSGSIFQVPMLEVILQQNRRLLRFFSLSRESSGDTGTKTRLLDLASDYGVPWMSHCRYNSNSLTGLQIPPSIY